MSDYAAISRARAAADDQQTSSRVTGLPPGYSTGYDLTLNTDYQVTVSAGTTTVFGSEVRIANETQLTDSMFTGSKLGPYWYYVYLARDGAFHIDRLVPSLSSTYFYYTHPLSEWRAIGRLWVSDPAGTIASEIIYVQKDVAATDNMVSVAAKNSTSQATAQYACTQSADEKLINAALQYLSEVFDGGVCQLLDGDFIVDDDIYWSYDNIHIRGEGYATWVRFSTPLASGSYTFRCEGTAGDKVIAPVVEYLRVGGTDAAEIYTVQAEIYFLYTTGGRISNVYCTATSKTNDCIFLSSADYTSVINVNCSEINTRGIRAFNSSYVFIDKIFITSASGLTGALSGLNLDTCSYAVMSNVVVNVTASNAGVVVGIAVQDCSFVNISSCHSVTVQGGAGTASGFTIDSIKAEVSGCHSSGTDYGFYITSKSDNATFNGCIVYNGGSIAGWLVAAGATNVSIVGCSTDIATPVSDSGTDTLVVANSWQMAAGVLTFPMAISMSGALDVAGQFTVGGGYGSTGVTISSAGVIQADGAVTLGSTLDVTGATNLAADLDVEVNAARTSLHNSTNYADYAHVSHYDRRTGIADYALLQGTGGDTYLNSPVDIYFRKSNTTVMKMNETGLNIGSSDDPAYLLTLRGTTPDLEWYETDTSKSWRLGVSGSDWRLVETGVGTVVTILPGGNVGIGTASPGATLEVRNSSITTGGTLCYFGDFNISGGLQLQTTASGVDWGFNALNSRNLFFNTNQTRRMTILAGGNVGIGTSSPDAKLQVVGTAWFGEDGTNYSGFESDGTLVFHGNATVFDDVVTPISITKPGGTAPTWTSFHGNLRQYTFGINDYVEGSFEVLHSYKEGSDIEIHVHVVTNGAQASTEVNYSFEYWIADMGEASTATTTITTGDYALTNADGHHEYINIGTITGTNYKIGAVICFLFKRIALVGGTNPTGDPFVVSVGAHYEKDTLGSRTETVK